MCLSAIIPIKALKINKIPKLLNSYFRTFLFWIVNAFIVFLCWLTGPILALFMKRKTLASQIWAKIWGKVLTAIATTGFRIEGLENIPKDTPVIYAPNHQSNLDWMILLAALPLPFRFVMKKELFKIPLFGTANRRAGYFCLDREAKIGAARTLSKVEQTIKAGESVVIFPEGTRTHDGKLGQFKIGSFLVAFETGAPIIPIAISGSFQIMPRYSMKIKPRKVKVKIGSPISFGVLKNKTNQEYQMVMDRVRDGIATMLSEIKE